jgi:hypothetical protein
VLKYKKLPADKLQIPMVYPLSEKNKGEFFFFNPEISARTLFFPDHLKINPYKGLDAYAADDTAIFFGRDRALYGWEEKGVTHPGLLELIDDGQFIIVSGYSGIGKTSLVRVGVSSWQGEKVLEIRPGKTPYRTNRMLLTGFIIADPIHHIIMVDQFEELLTMCQDKAEREQFENLLLAVIRKNIKVIINIRSDFEQLFNDSPLFNLDNKRRFVVPPFSYEEIREIVVRPAAQEVLEFKSIQGMPEKNEGFINRIVDDAYQYPGSLPLLSLALSELYIKKEGRNLLESVYNSFNGLAGILDNKAITEFEKLSTSVEREVYKLLIFRLISFEGEARTKKRVYTDLKNSFVADDGASYDELDFGKDSLDKTNIIKQIARQLVHERLLKADIDQNGQPYIEPTHDALLRTPAIERWLNERPDEGALSNEEKARLLYKRILVGPRPTLDRCTNGTCRFRKSI